MKVGDRVVCVKAHSRSHCPLKVGREYIIYSIKKCKCGNLLDVGITTIKGSRCYVCNEGYVNGDITWWLKESLFRKVEENKEVNYVKLEIKIEEPCLN